MVLLYFDQIIATVVSIYQRHERFLMYFLKRKTCKDGLFRLFAQWTHQGEINEKLMSSHMQFLLALEIS